MATAGDDKHIIAKFFGEVLSEIVVCNEHFSRCKAVIHVVMLLYTQA